MAGAQVTTWDEEQRMPVRWSNETGRVHGLGRVRGWLRATNPRDPEMLDAVDRRWRTLPEGARTPAQLIGRHSTGCEGTHGVFPACDFACKPCYHSADANKVRVDGDHTRTEVARQMAFLRAERSPRAHAQLIGGEVTLLSPEDHAATIDVMRAHGRLPMSFTHGDVGEEHLRAVALGPDGRRRWREWSWAVHIDTTMFGRTGAEKATDERQLHPYRAQFCAALERLRREHGVRHYIAHNMTVTPANVGQVAEVIRAARTMGFRMFSFQPAAFVGNEVRWKHDYREISDDIVWYEMERGVGRPLPYRAIQFGDLRCNRVTWGAWVGDTYVPLLDEDDRRDLAARDAFLGAFRGNAIGMPGSVRAARVARTLLRRPRLIGTGLAFARRFVRRAGGPMALRHGLRPMTFVMHSFMDARVVAPAWEAIQRGETAADPAVRAAQERLQACAYTMGHPDTGELVPACVQHGVLDLVENRELATLLPLPRRR
jgi:hypothetical protein